MLQSEKLDLTMISSLVEATLHTIYDALNPPADWMLALRDMKDDLEKATPIEITLDDIKSFKESVGKPFVVILTANISSMFSSQDVVSAFSTFDPTKILQVDSPHSKNHGERFLGVLIEPYAVNRIAQTLDDEE